MAHLTPDDHTITQAFVPAAADDPGVTRTSDATAHDAAPPPAVVPGYRLERELGRGGMGVVYLATQDGLNRQVALKMVLSGDHASATEKGRFLAEAEAVAAVRHPGVVQVFDFGTHDGRPFFALEFLAGGSLTDKLKGTPLPAKEAAKLVEAIARAVQAAHDVGVIHRDLKPGNILFDADGTPKVTDFGLARKGDSNTGLTATGAILGTPSYMAPEQAEGRKDVGPAADVYAVGAILYECLTGRPPFRAATPLETIHQVLKDDPVPPSRFSPKLPRDVETVCLKCLSKDPRKRYPTAGAVADDLHRFLTGEPIVARPVSAAERGWRWVKRNPLLAVVVVGGPLLLVGTTLIVLIALLMTAAANWQLASARLNAEARLVEARQEREKAHARLEKAVEAVDKMMTRVNSERWATNPALQDERRQVLEDAVAFFAGFTGEDSNDPRVRAETAKAHTRVGGAYLMLSELDKSAAAFREAILRYDGLMAEFPDHPEYQAAASEVHALLGNTHALSARYDDARVAYWRAVELADLARVQTPLSTEYMWRAVEARASLGYFYMQFDRAKGAKVIEPMLKLGVRIGGDPDDRYEHRVAYAFALTVAALYDLTAGNIPAMLDKYTTAERIVESVKDQPAPTGRAWELLTHTRAIVAVQLGTLTATALPVGLAEKRAGASRVASGVDLYDTLLRANPKAFPYLLQKFLALRGLADIRSQWKEPEEAEKLNVAADRLLEGMLRENPHLDWVVALDVKRQSELLIGRVRAGDAFEGEAEKLLALARPNLKGTVTYNVACVYAVAAGARPKDAEKHATRAVALLTDLIPTGYYRTNNRTPHLDKDTDLDPLRKRDDYKAFREAVNKANAAAKPATPTGREVK
jgi:tetratricopeptide (TPR) repeat protein/predicted Ser/Thr protein kinase